MYTFEELFQCTILGIGATIFMDLYTFLIKKVWGISSLNYNLVGRWFIYLKSKRIRHQSILTSKPKKGENLVGWILHYVIGILFSYCFILIVGDQWFIHVRVIPSIVFGLITVSFPYFLLQPCLGFGIAASKLPYATSARIKSLFAHCVFGLGLYLTGYLMQNLP